jgi:hypothetical protein
MPRSDAPLSYYVYAMILFAGVCVVLARLLVGCAAPGILGKDDPASITHPCDTGGSCPTGYDCPPLGNPTGPCEAHLPDIDLVYPKDGGAAVVEKANAS